VLSVRSLASTPETAQYFGCNPETLRRLYRNGRIPAYKVGRVLKFDIDEVRTALRAGGSRPDRRAAVTPNFDAIGVDR
jgi:excisionase family DNA binding protein